MNINLESKTNVSEEILFREATVDDAPTIVDFNCRLADESEEIQLDPATVKRGVDAVFQDPSKARYFVAVQGDKIVGQLMITYEWSDWRNGNIWWLQSVYVAASARRQGVFRRLFEFVEQTMQSDPTAIGIRLYVENENRAAQATYETLSFVGGQYQVMQRLKTDY